MLPSTKLISARGSGKSWKARPGPSKLKLIEKPLALLNSSLYWSLLLLATVQTQATSAAPVSRLSYPADWQREVATRKITVNGSPPRTTTRRLSYRRKWDNQQRPRLLSSSSADGPGPEVLDAVQLAQVSRPGKPTNFEARAESESVILSWDAMAVASSWDFRYKKVGESWGSWTNVPDSDATTTGHTVENLTNGDSYTFQVRAVNGGGNGVASIELTIRAQIPPPAKPRGIGARPRDKSVELSWNAIATATGWQYRQKVGNGSTFGDWINVPLSGAATTGYTITGLSNGSTYTFEVRAVNLGGTGTSSNELTATPVPLPGKPTGLQANRGNGEVTLSWTAGSGGAAVSWRYKYAAGSGPFGQWQTMDNSNSTTTTYTVTGLTNGTEYTFKIQARNRNGPGPQSDEAKARPRDSTVTKPGQATGLTATAGNGQVVLNWTAMGTATSWRVRFGEQSGSYGPWLDVPASDSTTTSYTVTGLTNGVAYKFRVRARNAGGLGQPSAAARATPVGPPVKPSGLTATPGNGRVRLSWDAIKGATEWDVRHRQQGQSWGSWSSLGQNNNATSHTVSSLTNGTTYEFQVRANVSQNEGPASDTASGRPSTPPIKPILFARTSGDTVVTLGWSYTGPQNSTTGWEAQYRRFNSPDSWGAWTALTAQKTTLVHYSAPVTGLTNGVRYQFRIRARYGDLTSPVSNAGLGTPRAAPAPPPRPPSPTGVSATAGNGQVVLQWTAVTGVARMEFRQAAASTWSDWVTVPGGGTATRHTVSSLTNGTAYTFQLRGVARQSNTDVFGVESRPVVAIPVNPPGQPMRFNAQPDDGEVRLSWLALRAATEGYEYRQQRASQTWSSWTGIPGSGASTTTYTVTGLTNDNLYSFQVRAENAAGYGTPSATVTATPKARARKPAIATTPGDKQIQFSWAAQAAAQSWEYQVAEGSGAFGSWTAVPMSSATTTGFTLSSLTNGTPYTIRGGPKTCTETGLMVKRRPRQHGCQVNPTFGSPTLAINNFILSGLPIRWPMTGSTGGCWAVTTSAPGRPYP